MNKLLKLLLDAKDNLEWIMGREEWETLKEGSSADITVKEINNINMKELNKFLKMRTFYNKL